MIRFDGVAGDHIDPGEEDKALSRADPCGGFCTIPCLEPMDYDAPGTTVRETGV